MEADGRRAYVEATRRVEQQLEAAGWLVAPTVASSPHPRAIPQHRVAGGELDFALFVGERLVGLVEVKARLSPAAELQVRAQQRTISPSAPPVAYLSDGRETLFFTAPGAELREVASFHSPETLAAPERLAGLAQQLTGLPRELPASLRPHQRDALAALELSLRQGERRALLILPTGAGRTTLLATATHRLLRHTPLRRVLVLVTERVVAEQTAATLAAYADDGRTLAEDVVVEVPRGSETISSVPAGVVVVTVQRMARMLAAEPSQMPRVDAFDFVWVLDPERLTGGPWQQALDRFDAPIVGLTTRPTPALLAYFDGNVAVQLDTGRLVEDGVPAPGALSGRDRPEAFVVAFLTAYLEDRRAKAVLDPEVRDPTLLSAIVETGAAAHGVGIVPEPAVAQLARTSHPGPRIEWVDGDPAADLDGGSLNLGAPDLVVSAPGIGRKLPPGDVTLPDGRRLRVRGDSAARLLLRAARDMAPDGEAIFLLGDAFLFDRHEHGVRAALASAGLHVHAVVALREGLAGTHASTSLVFVRRTPVESVFVGELSRDSDHHQLASQLRRRRRGAAVALGRLVPWERFESFEQLAAFEQLEALLAEASGEPIPLLDLLAGAIARPRRGEDVAPVPNAVYLPTFATGTVHAAHGDLTSRPWGYFQIPLDPTRASAPYVATLLNSPLGQALRDSVARGTTLRSLSLAALQRLSLPLPPLDAQREVVHLHGRIEALRVELDAFARTLMADPSRVHEVSRELQLLGQHDPLRTLHETLPFPLASILWSYEANADVATRIDRLHRLFEASAIWFATVLLSALHRDAELFERIRPSWTAALRPGSFRRASFGTWTTVGERIAADVRDLLGDAAEERSRLVEAFAGSPRLAASATSAELWRVLDQAREIRNREKGHGGIAGRARWEDTHERLAHLLTRMSEAIGPSLDEVMLVRPGAGRRRKGVVRYEHAEVLHGAHDQFRQQVVATTDVRGLEDGELHLVRRDIEPVSTALLVLPFVRVDELPETGQNACYLFSGIDGPDVSYVSHHFLAAPDITLRDHDLAELVATL